MGGKNKNKKKKQESTAQPLVQDIPKQDIEEVTRVNADQYTLDNDNIDIQLETSVNIVDEEIIVDDVSIPLVEEQSIEEQFIRPIEKKSQSEQQPRENIMPVFSPLSSNESQSRRSLIGLRQRNHSVSQDSFEEVPQASDKQSPRLFIKKDKRAPQLYDFNFDQISQRLLLFLVALSSVTLIEGVIGLSLKNEHILRNFFQTVYVVLALGYSVKVIDEWNQGQQEAKQDTQIVDLEGGANKSRQLQHDRYYNFGYRRLALLATFFNCSLLICVGLMDFLEQIHHLTEHWETEKDVKVAEASDDLESQAHSGESKRINAHKYETQFFVSIFALARLCLVIAYSNFELRKYPLHSYTFTNWMGIKQREKNCTVDRQTKEYLKAIQAWSGIVMLLYSIQLVMFCQCLRSFGQLWHHFLCLNFGLIEHIASFQLISLTMLPVIPLLIDVICLFMQRVNPPHLYDLVMAKIQKLEVQHSFSAKNVHLWALDKSFIICQLRIIMEGGDEDSEKVKELIKTKLKRKWCSDVIVET